MTELTNVSFKEVLETVEVLDRSRNGLRASRPTWHDQSYICKAESEDGFEIVRYIPGVKIYRFSDDIYFSNEWVIDGSENKVSFAEAIIEMAKGKTAALSSWGVHSFLSIMDKQIVLHYYEVCPANLNVDDFLATDWNVFY